MITYTINSFSPYLITKIPKKAEVIKKEMRGPAKRGRATKKDLRSPADLSVRSASEASAEVGGGAEQYNLIISEFTSY